ncbi:hypothetical protein M8R20_42115 [Pseudomonas sp. R2.Fl]|nr:hypothetical protein [Pseudomonas sp. R2.Fl]
MLERPGAAMVGAGVLSANTIPLQERRKLRQPAMTIGKKLATHVAPTGGLLIILPCLGLLAGCLSDTLDAAYGNLAEARADGAIDRGWIPAWVPESATALHEVHNLDTNVSALAFDLPGDTRIPLPGGCLPATYAQTLPVRFARSWWPSQGTLARSTTSSPVPPRLPNSNSSGCATMAATWCTGVPTRRTRPLPLPSLQERHESRALVGVT